MVQYRKLNAVQQRRAAQCGMLVHTLQQFSLFSVVTVAEQVVSSYRKPKFDYVWLYSIVVLLLLQKKRGILLE